MDIKIQSVFFFAKVGHFSGVNALSVQINLADLRLHLRLEMLLYMDRYSQYRHRFGLILRISDPLVSYSSRLYAHIPEWSSRLGI